MPNKPDKASLLAVLDAAKNNRESAEARLRNLLGEVEQAQAEAFAAAEAHERAHEEAHGEDIVKTRAQAEANHARHRAWCSAQRAHIESRKANHPYRGAVGDAEPIDHTSITKATIDGYTHQIVSAHGLRNGHHGFGDRRREASRYVFGCTMSVDAPHDELYHERFDQKPEVNCPGCLASTAAPSDYLTADEHLAHQRARVQRRNRESNGRR